MADNTVAFELVAPERLLFSADVDMVVVPGSEGDFGVLAGHAPVVAAIRPGILTITSGGAHQKIIVLGGLAEMSENGLTVLADVATSMADVDRAQFAETIAEMEARLAEKEGSELDHANETLQSLFDAQLAHIKFPLHISGFRGDAIFMYVPEKDFISPQSLVETLENQYIVFSETLQQMRLNTTCPCRACQNMKLLDLKMCVHHGEYLIQKLGDREELLGDDVCF